jgi:type IV pilus assembly protein PilZ
MSPIIDDRYTKTEAAILAEVVSAAGAQPGILAWVSYRRAVLRISGAPKLGEEVRVKAALLPHAPCEVIGTVQQVRSFPEVDGAVEIEVKFTRIVPASLAVLQTYLDAKMERRRNPRVHVELPVHMPRKWVRMPGSTVNLSRGGMFVRTEMPVPVGTKIRLRLDLGEDYGGEIVVEGTVAYLLPLTKAIHLGRHPGLGIHFDSFQAEGAQAYQDFLDGLEIDLEPDEGIVGTQKGLESYGKRKPRRGETNE